MISGLFEQQWSYMSKLFQIPQNFQEIDDEITLKEVKSIDGGE